MRVGVFTFLKVLNYGAVLQAYALQKVLKELGHDAFIVNYQPVELTKPYKIVIYKKLYSLPYVLRLIRRFTLVIPFKKFISKSICLGKLYNSCGEIYQNPPQMDACIVGSDQIWNSNITKNNNIYFLPFKYNNIIKIAYAASCGGEYSFLKNKDKVEYLKDFNAISVREKSLKKEMEKHEFTPELVLDPTLLINDYSEFVASNKNGEYILVYNVAINDDFINKLSYLKTQINLPIINVGPHHLSNATKNIYAVNPSSWVSFIYHAKLVFTNSFHAVAFSINFKNRFLYIPTGISSDSRITDLLTQIGLDDYIINNIQDIDKLIIENKFNSTMNWDKTDMFLEKQKHISMIFLNKYLTKQT